MNDVVLQAIRARAGDPATQTDMADLGPPPLAPPASPAALRDAEHTLGFSLWPDHRQLLQDFANGGFGPGYGLLGIDGGTQDDEGRTLVDLHQLFFPNDRRIAPLCDFGCGIWAGVDSSTGSILTLTWDKGPRFFDRGISFEEWMAAWARGARHWDAMFEFEQIETLDRRTKQKVLRKRAGKPLGTPYLP